MYYSHVRLGWLLLLSSLIVSLAPQAQAANAAQVAQVVQGCQYGDFPKYYSRIRTNNSDPLRVRASANGKVIGSIPHGWAVVVLEWSRNGVWAKVTSHHGGGRFGPVFSSAPDFQEGWVAAAYLEDLGRFCEKPESVAQLAAPNLFGAQPVEVQSDWLAMGDALAVTTRDR
jgi:Bacterial SH3 domain